MISALLDIFTSFIAGPRLIDGGDCLNLAKAVMSSASGITAHAGGGQTSATPLTQLLNQVDTCATNADSVMLPLAIPGQRCFINNNTANTVQVFGNPSNPNNSAAGDTIASSTSTTQEPTATGVAQLTAVPAWYVCTKLGQWKQFLSA